MDRISKLPDELLRKILSELDSRDAVQTSVLSKRWVDVWTTLPCLKFKPNSYKDDGDCCKFVTNFLTARDQQSVLVEIVIDSSRHLNTRIYERLLESFDYGEPRFAPTVPRGFLTFGNALDLTSRYKVHPQEWRLSSLTSLCLL
ncbi:F-box/FBD/LRR-repeat protein At2g26030-like [Apium graveolens]|uniref:F-box/FBD/LRR-repeat protein At2g26030-like n=1 Tax=Apium graveolens TaxID=4045 RepID=UPI003D7A278C